MGPLEALEGSRVRISRECSIRKVAADIGLNNMRIRAS
jgi:hypothetical protein